MHSKELFQGWRERLEKNAKIIKFYIKIVQTFDFQAQFWSYMGMLETVGVI